jgi:hypothetical protein
MKTVTLIDGREVSRDSLEWRDETLARHVLAMLSLEHRRLWIEDFEKRRGASAADTLRSNMIALHKAARK